MSFTRAMTTAMLALSLSGLVATGADARRGGSFGSRGSRTYMAPRPTYGTSGYVAPVERSMTPRSSVQASPYRYADYSQARPYGPSGSRFGGFGSGLIGGLIAGGLIGHFFGGGWNAGWGHGSGSGLLSALIQLAVIGGLIWLVLGFFRRRQLQSQPMMRDSFTGNSQPSPASGPWAGTTAPYGAATDQSTDIPITESDQRDFERLLIDVQNAFGREDYASLRQLTTPEIMSYLSEELSQNATQGLRNEVTNTRLVDAEVSEAWRDASGDYATIAMRYESRDVMLDRATGAIKDMSQGGITETLEYWTFVRGFDGVWKLSAIQET